MPLFYHYTDDEGAQRIIRTGRVLASLKFMSGGLGDTAYGNGVYLTQLNPRTFTKTEKAINNWMNANTKSLKKTETYFVFNIPESDVKDIKATGRNIFLYGFTNDLLLHKYPWWLKNFDSNEIIASYRYKLMSLGPASESHFISQILGDYIISEETVNGRPMYVGPGGYYLFMCSNGSWVLDMDVGGTEVMASQVRTYSLGPDPYTPWHYSNPEEKVFNKDDSTLKAYAWQV